MEDSVINNSTKPTVKRSMSSAAIEITDSLCVPKDDEILKNPVDGIRKSSSVDSSEPEASRKTLTSVGSFKRRSIRRRSSKRASRPEPEFGHDTEAYEKIRERVLQERAVTNAIDALQERYRMLTFMYDDCIELNNGRKERRLKKLSVQRQFELIVVISAFILICLPISISIVVLLSR